MKSNAVGSSLAKGRPESEIANSPGPKTTSRPSWVSHAQPRCCIASVIHPSPSAAIARLVRVTTCGPASTLEICTAPNWSLLMTPAEGLSSRKPT